MSDDEPRSKERSHLHACQRCGRLYKCSGDLSQNYDGWPEVVCEVFHVGQLDRCQECENLIEEATP